MSRTFKLQRKFYDGRLIYKKAQVTIEPGVTVLVGCNGAGKSTLIYAMQQELKKHKINFVDYDNTKSGGNTAAQYAMDFGDIDGSLARCFSSEGENININLTRVVGHMVEYVRTGDYHKKHDFARAFAEALGEPIEYDTGNERWIFLDGIDSGYSIDNLVDLKQLFGAILLDCANNGLDPYIIVAANAYELCRGSESCEGIRCLSVQDCKYVDIPDYDSYRQLILKTRKWKDNEIDKFTENG